MRKESKECATTSKLDPLLSLHGGAQAGCNKQTNFLGFCVTVKHASRESRWMNGGVVPACAIHPHPMTRPVVGPVLHWINLRFVLIASPAEGRPTPTVFFFTGVRPNNIVNTH